MQGLLDGAPVVLREQDGIAPLAGDLHRLVGLAHLVNQGVEPLRASVAETVVMAFLPPVHQSVLLLVLNEGCEALPIGPG